MSMSERDFSGISVHRHTLDCALSNACLPCLYKINPSGIWNCGIQGLFRLPANQRPECCPHSKSSSFEGIYSSRKQRILTVGDGDFSFSLSLANYFADKCAKKLVCTSHASFTSITQTYSGIDKILTDLRALGVTVLHEIDATSLIPTLSVNLSKIKKFDVVIWNFPCVRGSSAGADGQVQELRDNVDLLRKFFKNVEEVLRRRRRNAGIKEGEVHITHKTIEPFCWWDLKSIALESGFECIGTIIFDR